MRYSDGNEAKLGDAIVIDERYKGIVVANVDGGDYGECYTSGWEYLKTGILVETDFAGLVHYSDCEKEHIVLVRRAK